MSQPAQRFMDKCLGDHQTGEVEDLVKSVLQLLLPTSYLARGNGESSVELNKASSGNVSTLGCVASRQELDKCFTTEFPNRGGSIVSFREKVHDILRFSVNSSSAGFLDKLYSAPSAPGIAAELLLAVLNNNAHVWHASPALSAIEQRTGRALAELFGLNGPESGGVTMPGGAASNTTALLIARNLLLPSTKSQGVYGNDSHGAIFVSEAAHYSILNAAQIVGLGTSAVYRVSTTSDGCMDPVALERAVQTAHVRGQLILFIAATSGTTVKGAFDPLRAIGKIAHTANAWFHVDACWGGAAVFSESLRSKLDGCELADSISFNPHKILGLPLVCSFLLARDLRTFWVANRLEAGYLFHDSQGEAREATQYSSGTQEKDIGCHGDTWRSSPSILQAPLAADMEDMASLTVQCGRKPDAVKFYLHWNYHGLEGMGADVENAVRSARYLSSLVRQEPMLNLVLDTETVPFAQVCFYVRHAVENKCLTAEADAANTAEVNTKTTRALSSALRGRGWMVDFAPGDPKHGELGDFLRVVCHRLTTTAVVDSLVHAITSEIEKFVSCC